MFPLAEKPQNCDRAQSGNNQVTNKTIPVESQYAGRRAADKGSGNADKNIGQHAMIAVHRRSAIQPARKPMISMPKKPTPAMPMIACLHP